MPEAPYKQSRAALRERFGTRSIGYAGQSPLDSTPSGRAARAMEEGKTEQEAEKIVAQQFRKNFEKKGPPIAAAPVDGMQANLTGPMPIMTRQSIQSPTLRDQAQGYTMRPSGASPEDIGMLANAGAIGTLRSPFGTITLPNTLPAAELAEFIPSTAGPLAGFGLPKPKPYLGSVMTRANRWRQ